MRGFHSLYCIKKYGFSQAGCPVRIGSTTKEMPVTEIEMRYKKRFESSNDYMTKRRAAYGKEVFGIQDGFIQVTIPFNKKVMKNRGTINGTLKSDNLTNNELTLLGIVLSNPSISLSDAGDRMGISRRTVSRIVASL